MEKLDLRKELKYLYAPSSKHVELVTVPEFGFAMVDGTILPGTSVAQSTEFQQAVGALYGVSYTLKFSSKLRQVDPLDYPVMPLEGLWWNASGEFDRTRHEPMFFTAMILQPDHITPEMFKDALERLRQKQDNPAVDKLRLERFAEGLCVQTMHVGPYAEELATIAKMHSFAAENGYEYHGKHHEIYLGDPRRATSEKLRTVLRKPVGHV